MPNRAGTHADLAHRLRLTVSDLVRTTRTGDRIAAVAAGVLELLDRHGELTTAELAALRRVRHQTMATTVAELVELGLAATRPHPVDGRKKQITVTKAGRAALTADARQRERRLAEAMSDTLDSREVATVEAALTAIERMVAVMRESDAP